MTDAVLRFGGVEQDDAIFERSTPTSELFQVFGMWLGAVYAMEHDVAVDPDSLAAFDPVSVMPLYHQDSARGHAAARQGLTIEQSWLMEQLLLRRPSTCVIVDRVAGQPLDRITRLRVSTAGLLVDELIGRLARNFRFEGRLAWVAALEDAYFEAAPMINAGVLIGQGGHAITLESANPLTRELLYYDPWPAGTLVPGGAPSGQGHLWRISADALADVIVFATIANTPPVERSPDIYAETVRREADPAKGAPLDVAWHAMWQLGGPTYCLVAEDRVEAGSIERIPYRAELPAGEIVAILAQAYQARPALACVGHVRVDVDRGHSVHLRHVDAAQVVFHDPWPKGSLLAAGRNTLGIDAQRIEDGWRITPAELERCLQAVFISPEPLAEMQGREYRRRLQDVLAELAFFNIRETGRVRRDDLWEVEARTGGFIDKVRIRFVVDEDDWLEAALLEVERAWLNSSGRPFGIDIVKSFMAATVSPLDGDEAQVAVRAVEALMYGPEALRAALGSGAPHLLGQARALVAVVLGAQDTALVTYPFTRVVAAGKTWLQVGLERSGRSAGPFLAGAALPAPWNGS